MIKLKNIVFENTSFFETLQKVYKNKELKPKYAFKLYKLAKTLEEKNVLFSGFKQQLLDQYGEVDPEDQTKYIVQGDQRQEFTEKYNELLNDEIDLDFDKFVYVDELAFAPGDFIVLEQIFDYTPLEA